MLRPALITLLLISLFASACAAAPQPAASGFNPTATMPAGSPAASPAAASAAAASATDAPPETAVVLYVTATPMPTPTSTQPATATRKATGAAAAASVASTPLPPPGEALAGIIDGPEWDGLGLAPERAAAWEAFAAGKSSLDSSELRRLNDFLAQWRELEALAGAPHIPSSLAVTYRTLEGEDDQGNPRLLLYPEAANGRPALVARTASGKAVGLVAAPSLEGFEARIRPDGQAVQYVDARDGHATVRLYVEAAALKEKEDKTLLKALALHFARNTPYMKNHIFPRFYFPAAQVETAFYGVDKLLTYPQIVHMNEAFDLFNRPELEPLKTALFTRGTSVVVIENLNWALGVTFTGSKVMAISRRNLLGNRYEVAEVLAHEGAHVIQGPLPIGGDLCAAKLKREVAGRTIPEGFTRLPAGQVMALVRAGKIGTYHVSLWVLSQLGVSGARTDFIASVIRTGTANGQPVVVCEDK